MSEANETICTEEIRRLPLWRDFLEKQHDSITFGSSFSTEQLEEALSCKAESVEFSFAVLHIRKALRKRGMNFTSRGQNGAGFYVAHPSTNAQEMERLQRAARESLKQGVILGTNTPIELLSAEDRRRHEAICEKMAMRSALLSRTFKREIHAAEGSQPAIE